MGLSGLAKDIVGCCLCEYRLRYGVNVSVFEV